jgi:hypothetical protein
MRIQTNGMETMSKRQEATKRNRVYSPRTTLAAACGLPDDLKVRLVPYGPKECEKCARLKGKTRKCLSCEEKFIIGCKRSFVCEACFQHNQKH